MTQSPAERIREIEERFSVLSNDIWSEHVLDDCVWLLERVERLEEALEKIKDGGVPPGVLANVQQRMLAMCDIAMTALKDEN